MKSKRTVFSPIVAIIYIATVLTFIISLFVEYKSSPAKIQARVDELARATTQNLSVNQAGSDEFQTAFLHSIGIISDIAGIQLSQNGYLIFSYPADLADNSPTRSPFVTVTERSLYAKNQDAVEMKVASYLIEPTSLYTKGLIAFFVILATTLFCATYLIYLYASEKKNNDSDFDDEIISDDHKKIEKDLSFNQYEKKSESEYGDYYSEPSFDDYDSSFDKGLDEANGFDDEGLEDFDSSDYSNEPLEEFPENDAFDSEETVQDIQEDYSDYEKDQAPDYKENEHYQEETVSDIQDDNNKEEINEEETQVKNESPEPEDSYYSDFQMPQSPSSTITQEEYQALTQDLLDEPMPEEENPSENVYSDLNPVERHEDNFAIEDEDLVIPSLLDDDKPEETVKETIHEEIEPIKAVPVQETREEDSTKKEDILLEEDLLPELNPIHTKLDMPQEEEEKEDSKLPPIKESSNEIETPTKKHPAGLFSPTTGFGWEEYMIPRLDSELIRAASGDQDLTVMTLEIPKIDWTSEEAGEICELILDLVKFKDLVFEYGEFGCTAIIQNMGIDEALKAAEDLHTNIIASLARRKKYYIVAIGLSARSLRLISGGRIAKESEQALIHALEDKSNPVVAFKVNPERYRNYIATESAKLNQKEPQLSASPS